ncbi:DUF6427 family protein [Tenacibaculum amylolyticum]|uniref:DUF6427 family protein n=1 Tax=Tenacibaculum amylolyticum TaxID=104269 RepID=UPI003895E1ED
MLTNFFSNTKPVISVFIIGLFLCYTTIGFFIGTVPLVSFGLFFWFFVLFGVANFVNSRNNLTFDNSFFFLFFVILLGYFSEAIQLNSIFYASLILMIYMRRVYSLQSPKNSIKKLFDSGFWIGICFLIEPFSILFFLMTYFAIILHQHLDYRKLLTPILGLLTPCIIFFTYHFWYDSMDNVYALLDWYTSYDFTIYTNVKYQFSIGVLLFLLLISLFLKTPKALAVKNAFRKNWILISLHLLLALVLMVIIKDRNGTEILYLLFPVTIIIANGFELFQKKWFADIILLLIFLGSFVPFLL